MVKQVYVKKNGTVWKLPISSWLGICKDGSRGAGYAFPDECVVIEGMEADPDSLAIKIDNWMAMDFKDFIAAYERGDITPAKPEPKKVDPLVNPQDHWVDTKPVIIEEPAPAKAPAKAKKPKAKKK